MTTLRDLVDQLLQRIGVGDADGAAALFAEHVDVVIPHDPAVWWIPEVRTRAEFAEFLRTMGAELVTEAFEVRHVLVDGDEAVVLGTMTDTVRRTGRTFTSPFSLHLTQRDGLFVRYHFLEHSAAVRDAAGG